MVTTLSYREQRRNAISGTVCGIAVGAPATMVSTLFLTGNDTKTSLAAGAVAALCSVSSFAISFKNANDLRKLIRK